MDYFFRCTFNLEIQESTFNLENNKLMCRGIFFVFVLFIRSCCRRSEKASVLLQNSSG